MVPGFSGDSGPWDVGSPHRQGEFGEFSNSVFFNFKMAILSKNHDSQKQGEFLEFLACEIFENEPFT